MNGKPLSEDLRLELLSLARRALEAHFAGELPPRLTSDRSEAFGEPRALFVTFRRHGRLRGCIGTLAPEGDLPRMVGKFALRAALEDPRFPPLSPAELPECAIEISVLTAPRPLERPEDVQVGSDGLIVEADGRSGLLLPQVATEWGFDREAFLAETCRKAGLPYDAWQKPGTSVWVFQAEVFGEGETWDEESETGRRRS
jgi:AmmeMemoRadiSam system protein A